MPDSASASDELIAREVGSWAEDKFYYLERACFIFSRGMKHKWQNRCFIDLFAGPGKSIIRKKGKEIDGSPLIALGCEEPFTHHFFVDANPAYIKALEERVRARYFNALVRYYPKDCNLAIQELVHDLPSTNTLSFAFIDPTSIQIHMSTIAYLASNRKVDLLINFTQHMALQRLTRLPGPEADLDAYFGDAGWKRILENARSRGEHEGDALREFYKNRLKALGYKAPSFGDQLIRSDRRRPLYYLLYASKHERGIDFWRKVTKRDHTGAEDLIGPIDE